MLKAISFLTFLLILVGCLPIARTESIISKLTSTTFLETRTVPKVETASKVEQATPVIPTITPRSSTSIVPAELTPVDVVKLCPNQLDLTLSEMGLKDSSRLIVTEPDVFSTDVALLDADLQTTPILADIDKTYIFHPSPDKQWLGFYTREETRDGYTYDLWVSSITGDERIKVLSTDSPHVYQWTDSNTLIVFSREDSAPIFRIHPFDRVVLPLEPIILDLEAWQFSFDRSGTKLIYLPPDYLNPDSWKLYDYSTQEETTAFPGMDISRVVLPSDVIINWKSNTISLAFMDESSLELVINVPPDTVHKQTFPTHKITFSDKRNRWYFLWWSSDSRWLAFVREFQGNTEAVSEPKQFYVLDTVDWLLYDYCIDPGDLYASADERFLATNPQDSPDRTGILVWELATGKRTWIDSLRVVGWAEVE